MAISDYNSILRRVKSWSNRSDLTDEQHADFIYFAGNMANQLLRGPAMEKTLILEVNSEGHVVIPFDFLELRSLTYEWNSTDSKPMERLAWDQFVNYYNSVDAGCGVAEFFSRQGPYWFISAKPPEGSKITCHYYGSMPDISPTEQVNWLSDLSPMTYIFGALYYLFLFVQDEERAAFWKTNFNEELSRLQALSDKSEYAGTALAVRARNITGS